MPSFGIYLAWIHDSIPCSRLQSAQGCSPQGSVSADEGLSCRHPPSHPLGIIAINYGKRKAGKHPSHPSEKHTVPALETARARLSPVLFG